MCHRLYRLRCARPAAAVLLDGGLGAIHRYGYAGQPPVAHEVMLLRSLDLADPVED